MDKKIFVNEIFYNGIPVKLIGRKIYVGKTAPIFCAVKNDLNEVDLNFYKNKIKVITTFPSLDTPICEQQVKELNNSIYDINPDITILGISKDLPFAQKRFCMENDIKNLILLSDYKYSSFGINYGLLVKEMNLIARSVIIIDKNDVIRYIQIGSEIRHELDFSKILDEIIKVTENPYGKPEEEMQFMIDRAENVALMNSDTVQKLMPDFPDWQLENGREITRNFKFKNFAEAKCFIDILAAIAEEYNHHPDIYNSYGKLKINLTTHKTGGLTQNDFGMAKIIDEIMI